jgi:hypothetical protein
LLGVLDERFFLWAPGLVHLATRDFLGGCIDKAELADGELAVCIADWRTEGSALHGAEGIKVAGAAVGIEDGAGLVVGEVGKGFFMMRLGEEQASYGIAGKVLEEACAGCCSTRADSCRNIFWSHGEAFAQLLCVELRDRENADAALVTARVAGEVIAGALRCRSERGIKNGEQRSHRVGGWAAKLTLRQDAGEDFVNVGELSADVEGFRDFLERQTCGDLGI